jgi:hypothetical protein
VPAHRGQWRHDRVALTPGRRSVTSGRNVYREAPPEGGVRQALIGHHVAPDGALRRQSNESRATPGLGSTTSERPRLMCFSHNAVLTPGMLLRSFSLRHNIALLSLPSQSRTVRVSEICLGLHCW